MVSDVGGCSELLINGRNGFLVNRKNKLQIKEKLSFLYNNTDKLKDFSENSRKLYKKDFNIKKMSTDTFKLYNEIME